MTTRQINSTSPATVFALGSTRDVMVLLASGLNAIGASRRPEPVVALRTAERLCWLVIPVLVRLRNRGDLFLSAATVRAHLDLDRLDALSRDPAVSESVRGQIAAYVADMKTNGARHASGVALLDPALADLARIPAPHPRRSRPHRIRPHRR